MKGWIEMAVKFKYQVSQHSLLPSFQSCGSGRAEASGAGELDVSEATGPGGSALLPSCFVQQCPVPALLFS